MNFEGNPYLIFIKIQQNTGWGQPVFGKDSEYPISNKEPQNIEVNLGNWTFRVGYSAVQTISVKLITILFALRFERLRCVGRASNSLILLRISILPLVSMAKLGPQVKLKV